MAEIHNDKSNTLITGTSAADSIENNSKSVTINGGAGNDSIYNGYDGESVSINGGAGNDYIDGGFRTDNLSIGGGKGNDTIYLDMYSKNALMLYKNGDGNDTIYGFNEDDSIKIYENDYSTVESGNDIIITVGNGKIKLVDGAYLSILNISNSFGDKPLNISVETNNTLISGTLFDDIVFNEGKNVTIVGRDGNDTIDNMGDFFSINAGSGNDSIYSHGFGTGDNPTIYGGSGNDYIEVRGNNAFVDGGDGKDTIEIAGIGRENATIYAGKGNDSIYNFISGSMLDCGDGDDTITNNGGANVTIIGGKGNDSIYNVRGLGSNDSLSISGGAGNDTIYSYFSDKTTINGGTGNDLIELASTDEIGFQDNYFHTLIQYNEGDGNDSIVGFEATSTLQIGDGTGTYSTTKSGKNIIVTVGTGKISLIGAASLSKVNIKGTKASTPSTETNSWKLSGTTATYGTSSKTLVTVSGVKSTSGLSISGKVVTVAKSSVNAKKITVSDGYTLKLADGLAPATKKAAWTISGTTATYKSSYKTAGYKLASDGKSITYSKATTATNLATINGVKSTSGLSVSGKVITVAKSSVNAKKITVSNGYTLKLADGLAPATKKAAWTISGTTATYKSSYKTAGYKLASDGKSITYSKATTATNLATVNGAKSTSGLSVSKNIITLKNAALNKKVTISGGYEFDFASDYGNATITGSKNADTITARGKKISINGGKGNDLIKILGSGTVNGGDGADIFYLKPNVANVIADYEEKDKISLASGSAEIEKSGDDVIFNGKITVKGGADKVISYIDAGGKNTYQEEQSEEIILSKSYKKDSYTLSDGQLTLDASAVTHDLTITGNKESNKIVGTSQDDIINGDKGADTILGGAGNDSLSGGAGNDCLSGGAGDDSLWGGAGTDTLIGGDGDDVFIYKKGDGKVIIDDFDDNLDRILVLSGKVGNPKAGKDVTFAVEDGQIIVKNGANKYIPIYYVDFENAVKQYRPDN